MSDLRVRVYDAYRERSPRSQQMHERASRSLPGGESRTSTAMRPYPTCVDRAAGTQLYDLDGNAITDFIFNQTSLVHGHAHPLIVSAITRQSARGTAWSATNAAQVELAEALRDRMPSLERIRFCNSGSEATMNAVKVARAFTGRTLVVKTDGAYHGTYEGLQFNAPAGRLAPASRGIPNNEADNILIVPFNDIDAAQRTIEERGSEIAAVVLTPLFTAGAAIPADRACLVAIRDIAARRGILLIFDEVISFRVHESGGQGLFGVRPDLTALGKAIGGGLPVGAFGGRADVMELYGDGIPPSVTHPGTFNGNPLTMSAGLAAVRLLDRAALDHLGDLGQRTVAVLTKAIRDAGAGLAVAGLGSVVGLWAPTDGSADPEERQAIQEIVRLIHLRVLTHGFKLSTVFAPSTVTTPEQIDSLAECIHGVLAEFRPWIERAAPSLLPAAASVPAVAPRASV